MAYKIKKKVKETELYNYDFHRKIKKVNTPQERKAYTQGYLDGEDYVLKNLK